MLILKMKCQRASFNSFYTFWIAMRKDDRLFQWISFLQNYCHCPKYLLFFICCIVQFFLNIFGRGIILLNQSFFYGERFLTSSTLDFIAQSKPIISRKIYVFNLNISIAQWLLYINEINSWKLKEKAPLIEEAALDLYLNISFRSRKIYKNKIPPKNYFTYRERLKKKFSNNIIIKLIF